MGYRENDRKGREKSDRKGRKKRIGEEIEKRKRGGRGKKREEIKKRSTN